VPADTFVTINGYELEYRLIEPRREDGPTLIFLHEGLGCVSLWRDFPDRLAERTGLGAVVYSRAGYGKSSTIELPRPVRFMHDEAAVLQQLITVAGIRETILVGHSDGASIALLYAGMVRCAGVRSLVLEAPHVFVEPGCLESIARIGEVYRTTDLPARLARHHGSNTDVAFRGWNEVWLDPEFKAWNIEACLPGISSPILVIQGEDDEYGTVRHIEAIQRQVEGSVEVLMVPQCGHAPHREHSEPVLERMSRFIAKTVVRSE
jgi:pimeloyl-ACP methyl ester carboxylesterase